MEITYDSGAKENVPLRLEIRKGEESRNINLPGGKRRVNKIEFRYNTKGMLMAKHALPYMEKVICNRI
ncbi:hypothetical protein [Galbibacter pacificus]|uniref:Uncharacterized protein n=1 Tax=Galbibacter pacificus TaxID=2996052 RepID=A0ABT6FTC0_9FLAO|nr:hypothetical protein [Galbibacter pacificus]MDG3583037.1 hypothetical protein [Galbibacter pacificus]MDG3586518.1 hypothetical protein [Galbibacter pacificus]